MLSSSENLRESSIPAIIQNSYGQKNPELIAKTLHITKLGKYLGNYKLVIP